MNGGLPIVYSMNATPLMIRSWPAAIVHVDADAFFASVEQTLHPNLKGKPVITGAERGIVAAASYEAKALGIKRAITLKEAKKICPSLICLPSDYETYSLFSKRLFAIMRRFTPTVEEYSIDEGFADLAGLRRLYRTSFPNIAYRMKQTIEAELGITVSVGLSLSKSLAKLCSKYQKPSGFTVIPGRSLHELLTQTTLPQVWGFGPNTVALLQKHGLQSALDFVKQPEAFAKKLLGKIGVELHQELSGIAVHPVTPQQKTSYATISKFKTFTPASTDRTCVHAQALKNLEKACMKARRYQLKTTQLILFLRSQDFLTRGMELKLSHPTSSTLELVEPLLALFNQLYKPGVPYRATGVVLGELAVASQVQLDFFQDPLRILKMERISNAIDTINTRYGKHKVHLATSLPAQGYQGVIQTSHGAKLPERKQHRLKGENFRQHLGLPVMKCS